jgi:hypothetical protein
MSKNEIQLELNKLQGSYNLILYSKTNELNTYIILTESSSTYSLFILKNDKLIGLNYDISLKKSLEIFINYIK